MNRIPLRHHLGDPIAGVSLCGGADLRTEEVVDHVDFLDERVDGPRCPTCAIACVGPSSSTFTFREHGLAVVSCGVDSCQRPALGWAIVGDEKRSACRTHLDPALGAIGGK